MAQNLELTYAVNLQAGIIAMLTEKKYRNEFPVFAMDLASEYLSRHSIELPNGERRRYLRRFRKQLRTVEMIGLRTSLQRTDRCHTLEKRIDGF